MNNKLFNLVVVLVALAAAPVHVHASIASKAVGEALEYAGRKFAKEVAEEGAERLASKMVKLAAAHGDDVVAAAVKKVGPRAARVATEAGEHSGTALRLMAKHGNSALPIVTKATSLKAVAHFGDDACEAIIKHGAVGEELLEKFSTTGAKALSKVTPRNARRMLMLMAEGQLREELVSVVAHHGDVACDWIWRNRGALTLAGALTAFVRSPEPFLNGTQQLASTVTEAVAAPLAEVPKEIAKEAAHNTNWTLLLLVAGAVAVFLFLERRWNADRVARLFKQWARKLRG